MSSSVLQLLSAAAAGADAPPTWTSFVPLVAMVVVFWFLIIRPQMRRQKEHQNKVAGLKKGDQVQVLEPGKRLIVAARLPCCHTLPIGPALQSASRTEPVGT